MTIVMHHHIYKNAGSTVDWILQRNFPNNVLHIEGSHPGARMKPVEVRKAAEPYPDHAAIASHTTPLPGEDQKWATCHLTILRHPVERLYSMYRYDRSRKDDNPASIVARDSDFRGYCEWWLSKKNSVMRNWQVRCCTPQSWLRTKDNAGIGLGWDADLQAARQTIKESAFAGVAEDFDKSMIVLESVLQEKGVAFDAAYVRQNATSNKTVLRSEEYFIEKLGQSVYEDFLSENSMDFELLDYANDLLTERFEQLADGEGAIDGFRSRCNVLADGKVRSEVCVPKRPDWIFVDRPSGEKKRMPGITRPPGISQKRAWHPCSEKDWRRGKSKAGQKLCFVHIPKTGGITVESVLKTYFVWEDLCPRYYVPEWPGFSMDEAHKYRLFIGHSDIDVVTALPDDVRTAIVLRHPLKQMLSLYNHIRERPAHPFHAKISDGVPFDSFIEMNGFRNFQANFLISRRHAGAKSPVSDAGTRSERAVAALDGFDLIGRTEDFPRFFAGLGKLLGVPRIREWPHLNSTRKKVMHIDEVTAETAEKHREISALDYILYAHVVGLGESDADREKPGDDRSAAPAEKA